MDMKEEWLYTVVTKEQTHYFDSSDSFHDFMSENDNQVILSIKKQED